MQNWIDIGSSAEHILVGLAAVIPVVVHLHWHMHGDRARKRRERRERIRRAVRQQKSLDSDEQALT